MAELKNNSMKIHIFLLKIYCIISANVACGISPYAPETVGVRAAEENMDDLARYSYDSAGNRLANLLPGKRQIMTMGLLTKPTRIQQESQQPEKFFYKPDTFRYLRVHADGRKTVYLPGMEYWIDGNTATSIVQVRAKGYSPDVQVEVVDTGDHHYIYLLKDHLGSPLRTASDTDETAYFARFDPWGLRVNAAGEASDVSDPKASANIRGYTGHEWIASAHLNHMNGRVYDPQLGLFLGPDRMLQTRLITSLNRYSLGAHNNPNVVDTSGWTWFPHESIDAALQGARRLSAVEKRYYGSAAERMTRQLHRMNQYGVEHTLLGTRSQQIVAALNDGRPAPGTLSYRLAHNIETAQREAVDSILFADKTRFEAEYDGDGYISGKIHYNKLSFRIERGSSKRSGKQMIDDMIQHFGVENINKVRGKWTNDPQLDTNFKAFKAALRRGVPGEQAALHNTFTGHVLSKYYGFTEVQINAHAETLVDVTFSKSD